MRKSKLKHPLFDLIYALIEKRNSVTVVLLLNVPLCGGTQTSGIRTRGTLMPLGAVDITLWENRFVGQL